MKAILDSSWFAHRAKYSLGNLSHADLKTGVIYGFLEQVRHVCNDPRIMSNNVGLFFDSKSSVRKAAYPEYKANRQKAQRSPEEWAERAVMRDQLALLRQEILPAIGFPCFQQAGLESDDLMAQAAEQLEGAGTVLVTADGDLYQCITTRNHWYDPQRNRYLDHGAFWKEYGIDPCSWAEVKAIAGCGTDNVKGVPGVGEGSAIKYILGIYPRHHKRYAAITSAEGLTIIQRNRGLVRLPHPDTLPLDIQPFNPPKYDERVFFKTAEQYGFKSFLEDGARRMGWVNFFNAVGGGLGVSRQIPRKRAV